MQTHSVNWTVVFADTHTDCRPTYLERIPSAEHAEQREIFASPIECVDCSINSASRKPIQSTWNIRRSIWTQRVDIMPLMFSCCSMNIMKETAFDECIAIDNCLIHAVLSNTKKTWTHSIKLKITCDILLTPSDTDLSHVCPVYEWNEFLYRVR